MVLHLRIPIKLLLPLLSLTGVAVAGAVWTFHGGASTASNGRAFSVADGIRARNSNHDAATSTPGGKSTRGKRARGKSAQGARYVSQMLMLAAGSHTLRSSAGRNFGFGANGVDSDEVDVSVNGVQTGSFNAVSVNLRNPAAGSHEIALAGHPSIPQHRGQPRDDDEPIGNIYPPTSGAPPQSDPPPINPPPINPPPPDPPPPTSVPDSGGTFLLMLCSGAGLLIMGRLASRQLEK